MAVSTNGVTHADATARHEELAGIVQRSRAFEPRSVEEVGIDLERLADLALKTFFVVGRMSARDLADHMRLPVFIAQEIIDYLRRAKLADSVAGLDSSERVQRYSLTDNGGEKAYDLLQRNRYVGPTPVPLETYCEVIRRNATQPGHLSGADLERALSQLVISREVIDQLGPAVHSARSLFIYGSPGNGKTTLAEALGIARGGYALVPYAIEARGEIIRVFDSSVHEVVDDDDPTAADDAGSPTIRAGRAQRLDRRWARVRRPLLVAGGELTIEQLELSFSPSTGVHQAPYQLKANGGTFLIDDFGRQRIRPADLLNRWIVPLEKGYDHLHLSSGDVIEIPFDTFVIFSTNLAPRDLIDEAFIRRIKYTVELADPNPDQYHEIFRRCCEKANLPYDAETVDYIIERYYRTVGRPMRSCHPRDIIERICDRASYEETSPTLDREAIDWACVGYFQLHG